MDERTEEFILEQAAKDPKVRAIGSDAILFDELSQHPGWRKLRERVLEEREKYTRHLGARLLAGTPIEEVQRNIDFNRGWYSALEWFTGVPEHAMESFEKAAQRAFQLTVLEGLALSEEDSPYT